MSQSLLSSGGSSLKLIGLVSAFSVVAVLAACAEAPVDEDPGGTTSNVNKAEPEGESQKLPPSNPPAAKQETKDAGTSSSGGSSSGSTSSSGGSSSGGSSATCDPNDPLNLIKALDELNKPTPRTCGLMGGSCAAGECCFDVYGVCLDP